MAKNFGEYMISLLTTPLRVIVDTANQLEIFFRVVGKRFDRSKEYLFRVRRESMVATASEPMLEVHGQDRNMVRLRGEGAEAFRRRLEMKAEICEKAGSREGILLSLSSLGYEEAEIAPCSTVDPERWAEFIVYLNKGNGQAIRDLLIVYMEILEVKPVTSKPAWLVFTDNTPFDASLSLGSKVSSYTDITMNREEELVLIRDREFDPSIYQAPVVSSYLEVGLNREEDLILIRDRAFDAAIWLPVIVSSFTLCILNSADDLVLVSDRAFGVEQKLSPQITSFTEVELI